MDGGRPSFFLLPDSSGTMIQQQQQQRRMTITQQEEEASLTTISHCPRLLTDNDSSNGPSSKPKPVVEKQTFTIPAQWLSGRAAPSVPLSTKPVENQYFTSIPSHWLTAPASNGMSPSERTVNVRDDGRGGDHLDSQQLLAIVTSHLEAKLELVDEDCRRILAQRREAHEQLYAHQRETDEQIAAIYQGNDTGLVPYYLASQEITNGYIGALNEKAHEGIASNHDALDQYIDHVFDTLLSYCSVPTTNNEVLLPIIAQEEEESSATTFSHVPPPVASQPSLFGQEEEEEDDDDDSKKPAADD